MVRPPLCGDGCAAYSMFMTAVERVSPPSPARPAGSRSPFVRLRELLGDTPPGKPAISLAVGEPQHAVPSFVGPVLAAHLEEFGRYPMNKGLEEFCAAAAQWLGRRFAPAAADRSGDRGAGAQRLARGPVPRRDRGRALGQWPSWPAGDPDAESVLRRLRGRRDRRQLRAGLPADDRGERLPARSRFAVRRPAPPHGRVLPRLARQPAGLGRRSGLSRHGWWSWRGASASCCSATSATRRSTPSTRPPSALEAAGPDFRNVIVFQSLSKRSNLPGHAGRLRGRRPAVPGALPRPAQRRLPAGAAAGATGRDRGLWRRGACRGEPPALRA